MFTLTSFSSPARSSTILSRTGETAWQGPHHSAQKSTITGLSLERTSCSKVDSVTAVDMRIPFLGFDWAYPGGENVPRASTAPGRAYSTRRIAAWRSSRCRPSPTTPPSSRRSSRWWEREGIFDKLREQNRGGERFSFIDGPITANNPMGVHHAWGRTLKDVFQRYKAMRGFDQRYQNGFDCQGLWVEVEVEKALGLNSKRDIEEYGLAEFAERCKERVAQYAEVITDQ